MVELPDVLEDDVLAVLCYAKLSARKISDLLEVPMFSSRATQLIVTKTQAYLKEYGQPPGGHLYDLLEQDIKKRGDEGKLIERAIERISKLMRQDTFNERFVVKNIEHFIRGANLRVKAEKFARLVDENKLDEAEQIMHERTSRTTSNSPGMFLHEADKMLAFMDKQEDDYFPTGIAELDEMNVMPARGTMMLMIAPPKRGKSWFLISSAKAALLAGRSVLHITCENSEEITGKRYIQSLYSLARNQGKGIAATVPRIHRDPRGKITTVSKLELPGRALDEGSRAAVHKKLMQLRGRAPVLIKGFPSGTLTMDQLDGYMHRLAASGFIPDEVVLDYPDLMKIRSTEDKRGELGRIFVELRGLAVDRNFALVTATQGTRGSITAKTVGINDVAEDISKVATADTVLTYSQTRFERRLNIARMCVAASRDSEDQFMVGMTQNYKHGQFCLDSWRYDLNPLEEDIISAMGYDEEYDEDDEDKAKAKGRPRGNRSRSS